MKSYSQLRNLYGKLTLDSSSANLTLGDEIINDEIRHLCSLRDFYWLRKLRTVNTIASTTFVDLPYDIDLVESIFVTVGSTRYVPKPAPSRKFWDELHFVTQTSDYPQWWFVYNGQLGLWPRPATSSNVISINGKLKVIDLSIPDITSATITTATVGSTSIVLSGGLGTQMTGFWIRPTLGTVSNTGDGQWYEISSVASGTAATLVRTYGGASISVGTAACTIAQMPLLPEPFHDTSAYKAASIYWQQNGNMEKANSYLAKYNNDVATLLSNYTSPNTDPVVDDGEERQTLNPNLTISI